MNKQRNQSTTGRITQGAAIAAVYVALTMIVAPIAFGPVQFRISEALCVLPYFLPSAVPGLSLIHISSPSREARTSLSLRMYRSAWLHLVSRLWTLQMATT